MLRCERSALYLYYFSLKFGEMSTTHGSAILGISLSLFSVRSECTVDLNEKNSQSRLTE